MNILVVNAYVRENGGDAALLDVLLRQLRETYPDARIQIAGMEDPHSRPEFEGVPNIGSIRLYTGRESLGTLRRWVHKLVGITVAQFWFVGPNRLYDILGTVLSTEVRAEVDAIRAADLVVSLGGGYLNGKGNFAGDLNVYFLLAPLLLAERLGKPVVCAPQSYGPFGDHRQERWVFNVLNKAELLMVREATSVELLTKLGIRPRLMHQSVDSGFAFEGPPVKDALYERFKLPKTTRFIGVTARQWLPVAQQAKYERAVATTIDYLQRTYGVRAVLIPQVTATYHADDDRIVEKRIASYCDPASQPLLIDESIDHKILKAMYGELDYLIGTRFHSVIFGLTSMVPCVAIEYEHKTGGIMHDLGLDEWVIKIGEVTAPKLIALTDLLIKSRRSYAAQLNEKMPSYIARADETPKLIRQVLAARHVS